MRKPPTNTPSVLQFFSFLPSEIVVDILSRLPIRTIVICKRVCRSWRDLLRTPHFADFHLSRSVPGLVIGDGPSQSALKSFTIFEFDDGEPILADDHDLHYKPLTKIDDKEFILYRVLQLQGSANGLLLLLRGLPGKCHFICVCNPITCEYIELQYDDSLVYSSSTVFAYGFGVSRMSRQYKVVRIFRELDRGARTMPICLVYTLGTGVWRSITPPSPFLYRSIAVYVNGNLHWLVQLLDGSNCISCFDLETETFTTFSLPSPISAIDLVGLVVLGDCLCVSNTTSEGGVDIWLMKRYGDAKSWTNEFVIAKKPDFVLQENLEYDDVAHPIKVFEDGDILMVWQNTYLVYYSNKTKTTKQAELYKEDPSLLGTMEVMRHTSSFLSLARFVNERLRRF